MNKYQQHRKKKTIKAKQNHIKCQLSKKTSNSATNVKGVM